MLPAANCHINADIYLLQLQQIRVEVHSMREVGEHAWLGRRKMKMRKALGGDSTARGSVTSTREASEISGDNAGSVAGSKSVAYDKLTLGSKGQNQLVKVKRGLFVPFVADYHLPRSHPPKHN